MVPYPNNLKQRVILGHLDTLEQSFWSFCHILNQISLNTGDSIQNILGDVLSCAVGYILGTVFLAIELWWLSIVWIVVSEVNKKVTKFKNTTFNLLLAAGVHPLHAWQPRPGHPHHLDPRPEAQAVAVRQDSQGGLEILLLPPLLVECKAQKLLDLNLTALTLCSPKYWIESDVTLSIASAICNPL